MLGKKVVCVTIFPHLYVIHIHTQCCPPTWQLHSDFRESNNGVSHVMKITMANLPWLRLCHSTLTPARAPQYSKCCYALHSYVGTTFTHEMLFA